jgi:hypothetical protein
LPLDRAYAVRPKCRNTSSASEAAIAARRGRFPPPWLVEDTGTGSAFVVKDSSGQGLAYVYYKEESGRRSAAKMLAKDEGVGSRPTTRCQPHAP